MRSLLFSLLFFPLPQLTYSHPTGEVVQGEHLSKRCGRIQNFYHPQSSSWDNINTQTWLNNWWNKNSNTFSNNNQGFAGALGLRYLGEPSFTCLDNGGQGNNCILEPCDNPVLNNAGSDIQPAYYALLSVQNLASHFQGVLQAYTESQIFAALAAPNWAAQFWLQQPSVNSLFIEELVNALAIIIGIAGSLVGGEGLVVGAAGAAIAVAASGIAGAINLKLSSSSSENVVAANLGQFLSTQFTAGIQGLTDVQNTLMSGNTFDNTGDIRSYISHGAYLDTSGVNLDATLSYFDTMVTAKAINALWTKQKVFILGGGPCDDSGGIGSGPQDGKLCRNNQAWYIYFWHEGNGNFVSAKQYGWVQSPPGASVLGQGQYSGITIQDVISSSFDSWNVAKYNYNSDTAQSRVESALTNGWGNPFKSGAAWEGTWTIPVCDVSWAIGQTQASSSKGSAKGLVGKQWVLQPYNGQNSRPCWCGPVCGGDQTLTDNFINAANMGGFLSPKACCSS